MKAQGLVCVGDEEDTVKEEIQEETNVTEVKVISDLTNTQTLCSTRVKEGNNFESASYKNRRDQRFKEKPCPLGICGFLCFDCSFVYNKSGKVQK